MDSQLPSMLTQERFALLCKAVTLARRRASDIKVAPDLVALDFGSQLHLRIIELIGACTRLMESGYFSAVPILLRTVYEALVDQLAIKQDVTYASQMAMAAIREGLHFPELINMGKNAELLKIFIGERGAREFLRALKAQKADLSAKGAEGLGIERKFVAAGIEHEYPFFRLLSGAVHSDTTELSKYHVMRDQDGNRRLSLSRPPDEISLLGDINMAIGSLLRSCRIVHGDTDPEIEAAWNQLAQFMLVDKELGHLKMPPLDHYINPT